MNVNRSKDKEKQETHSTPLTTPSSQLFESTIAKISVAQICQSVGFTGSQKSALDVFANIATRYIEALGESASSIANSSRRTQCNLFDVVGALEDLNSIQGFDGATNLKNSLLKSGTLKDIRKFVDSIDEIPFAKPIPRRKRSASSGASMRNQDQVGTFKHIPSWVPSFPEPATYQDINVKVCDEKKKVSEDELMKKCVKNVKKQKSFLPMKREKVKFKFGLEKDLVVKNVELEMRNGICRGGKRVAWCNISEEADMKSLKRRRR